MPNFLRSLSLLRNPTVSRGIFGRASSFRVEELEPEIQELKAQSNAQARRIRIENNYRVATAKYLSKIEAHLGLNTRHFEPELPSTLEERLYIITKELITPGQQKKAATSVNQVKADNNRVENKMICAISLKTILGMK